ncbi:hypothetical protein [Niabella aurantiaca]|uniref:hypothetical protein n=1 Tax=Niabella aurantiaca TaxID=379900 RepID=UPI0003741C9F|nr:hypothetical protein [Niabella aurantiaca]
MLKNDLYTVISFEDNAGSVAAAIGLNAGHKIFEGHFPGQPVLPGVCMIQIVKELTEEATGKKLFLAEAAQCKFLSMVDPQKTPELTVGIDYRQPDNHTIIINAVLKNTEVAFFKMSGQLGIV